MPRARRVAILSLLLPVVIQLGVWLSQEPDRMLRRLVLGGYVMVQLLALAVNMAQVDADYYLWFAPSLLAIYLYLAARRTQAAVVTAGERFAPGGFDRVAARD